MAAIVELANNWDGSEAKERVGELAGRRGLSQWKADFQEVWFFRPFREHTFQERPKLQIATGIALAVFSQFALLWCAVSRCHEDRELYAEIDTYRRDVDSHALTDTHGAYRSLLAGEVKVHHVFVEDRLW